MKHLLAGLAFAALAVPAHAEPAVAILLDGHNPAQTTLAGQARQCLNLLARANNLAPSQFGIFVVEPADLGQWKRRYALRPADLPALALVERSGNQVTALHNLVRHFGDPLAAAQEAFQCASAAVPSLVKTFQLQTGVHLDSQPPGAQVMLGTQVLGQTPCDLPLKPGHYQLTLQHPDCRPGSRRVDLLLGQRADVSVALDPSPSRFTFESPGAPMEITVDDRVIGTTPVSTDVPAGLHRVKATRFDFYTIDAQARAEPNMSMKVRLSPVPSRVRVAWGGAEAQGFAAQSQLAPMLNTGLSMAASRLGFGIPYFGMPGVGNGVQTVDVNKQAVRDLAQKILADQPHLAVVDATPDVSLKLQVVANPQQCVAVAQVVDAKGVELRTFTAKADMPAFTVDTAGSANARIEETAAEATRQAADWIAVNVKPNPSNPEATSHGMEIKTDGPFQP